MAFIHTHGMVVILLIVLSLSGCSKEQADLSALAEEPPRIANQFKFNASDSQISSGITIPYTVIKAAIYKGLENFETVPLEGTVDCSFDKEVKLGPIHKTVKIPCSSSYEGLLTIKQTGDITVTRSHNNLLLIAPVHVYGTVGLTGKTAQKLGFKDKKVDTRVKISLTLDFGLNTDWSPYVNVQVKHHWLSAPRIEVVKGRHMTFTKQADKFINLKLKEMPALINMQLAKLNLKQTISKSWKSYAIPINNLPIEDKVTLNITPKKASISNIIYTDTALNMAVGLNITTGLHLGKQAKPKKLTLPQLNKISSQQPAFKLLLPVHIKYQLIEDQINKKLAGQSFKQKTDVGDINIEVKNIFVYPSADKIVIGVSFTANVDGKHLKTDGKLFLVSKPVLDKNGTRLRLTKVSFSRDFNNALLNAITYVFKSKINQTIEQKAQFNLQPTIAKTLKLMKSELDKNQKDSGFAVKLTKPQLKLSRLILDAEQLVLEASLSGYVNVQLKSGQF